ncbi:MAG: hypothetical protein L6R42_000070 [Xanthoria sp. 1 TBL-2021]|nr:MAG: hypothetical protein L6R42_000070 [Xanthoria sp. 1 TBL-2021]
MFLFKDLSKGEHQARTDLVADFIKGDEEHFLQQLDRQDKQLIGIPTTSADNPQSRSKEFDDGPAKPGSKKRLTEIRGNEIAIKDEDTLMWEAEGPDESAVDNTSTPKTTEKSELVDNPKSAVAALDGKAVKTDPKFSDSKPAESTPAPSLLQSQNGHPKPEVGLLEFSMEVNDDDWGKRLKSCGKRRNGKAAKLCCLPWSGQVSQEMRGQIVRKGEQQNRQKRRHE